MSEQIGIAFCEQSPAGLDELSIRDEHCRFVGRANVSVGCNGSRPGIGLKSEELLFALPFASKMSEIII